MKGNLSISRPTDIEKVDSQSEASFASGSRVDEKKLVGNANEVDNHLTECLRWTATIGIEGMTCASCVGTITNILEPVDYVDSVNINLLANNGVVHFSGPRSNVDLILEAIEDAGYDASLVEIHEIQSKASDALSTAREVFKLAVSIDGMTCSACVGSITRGLKELAFVSTINIDLLSNKGIIEFEGESNKAAIVEKIDDLGYNVKELQCEALVGSGKRQESTERFVTISVEGTYCPKCPENIANALDKQFGRTVTITELPTPKSPRVTVSYYANPPDVTIRHIVSAINEADPAFSASVYHPPTDEERSSKIRRKHRNEILRRLVLAVVVAIPTFIIGIVYMSLVPKTNTTRMWFEKPIWTGNVTREEWALFIMTTPVYFFAADFFHSGALKDLRSLWRRKSKVQYFEGSIALEA